MHSERIRILTRQLHGNEDDSAISHHHEEGLAAVPLLLGELRDLVWNELGHPVEQYWTYFFGDRRENIVDLQRRFRG